MDDNSTPDDDDDWMKYANSGFGSTDYSLWDDVEEVEQPPEQADEPEQLESHTEEIHVRHPLQAGNTCFEWGHATLVWADLAESAHTNRQTKPRVSKSVIQSAKAIHA